MMDREFQYVIDCIDMSTDQWTYLQECNQTDTRLIKYYTKEGQYLVLRPAPLRNDKRLSNCGHTNFETIKTFPGLLEEIQYCDIKIPDYKMFISDTHTREGHRGQSLCVASNYIHGKCLPLDYNDENWKEQQYLFYKKMDKWLISISQYISYKFLSAESDSLFLTDVFRPIQFVHSFENGHTYLVDLDPLYDKIIKDNHLNKRFLIGVQTLNNCRNIYKNRLAQTNLTFPTFGAKCQEILIELSNREDFINLSLYDTESETIIKNLYQRLFYRKF